MDSDAERQAFRCVQLPAVEESVAVDRGLLQRADRRGVGAFVPHTRRSEFRSTSTCLLGLCVLYWRLVL